LSLLVVIIREEGGIYGSCRGIMAPLNIFTIRDEF